MTEQQIREQFSDVFCGSCGKRANHHGLHEAKFIKGTCVWTWIGVVKHALRSRMPSADETGERG